MHTSQTTQPRLGPTGAAYQTGGEPQHMRVHANNDPLQAAAQHSGGQWNAPRECRETLSSRCCRSRRACRALSCIANVPQRYPCGSCAAQMRPCNTCASTEHACAGSRQPARTATESGLAAGAARLHRAHDLPSPPPEHTRSRQRARGVSTPERQPISTARAPPHARPGAKQRGEGSVRAPAERQQPSARCQRRPGRPRPTCRRWTRW